MITSAYLLQTQSPRHSTGRGARRRRRGQANVETSVFRAAFGVLRPATVTALVRQVSVVGSVVHDLAMVACRLVAFILASLDGLQVSLNTVLVASECCLFRLGGELRLSSVLRPLNCAMGSADLRGVQAPEPRLL